MSIIIRVIVCNHDNKSKTLVNQVNLAGIFPPIVTPFNPDESIAWDKLRGNLAKWVELSKFQKAPKLCRWRQEPLSGYLVHGSNGEFAYLSPKERVDVIRVVKEEVILAQTGTLYRFR